ncbi:hypothetical protein FDECE_9520 [Fusarium decemcellulare]|nr:hypothetical protein FDECE_9520 [Fusarium decemcellulare]
MAFKKLAQLSLLAPAALGLVVPKGITPAELSKIIPRGPDQPQNPRLDFGKDSCFSTGAVGEKEEWTGCEPANKLDDDGNCPLSPHSDNPCETFCEKGMSWSYGKEVKFANAECRRGKCTLEDRMAVTFGETMSWGFQIGWGAITGGVSFTYSEEKQTLSGVVRDKPDDLIDECGYWTFVPYMVTSCGISAKGKHEQNAFTGEKCKDREQGDYCITDYLRHADGIPAGIPVFVTYDCATREYLGFCKQDELYLKMGVSEDEKVHQDYAFSWWDGDASKGPTSTAQAMCERGEWPPA